MKRTCRHTRVCLWFVAVLATVAVAGACGFNEPALQPLTREPMARVVVPPVDGKTAQFDIMAVDQRAQRLYVADSLVQGVDVVDVSTNPGRYLRTIPLNVAPKGLAVSEEEHLLFTGND